jgi:integrase
VAEKPFVWLQSAGEVQKLLGSCNDNIRTLVAVLVGTGMRLDEALHLMWVDIDLQYRVIHVHRGRRGAPKSGRMRHVPIFDSVLTVLREMKLAKGENTLLWPGAKRDEKFDEQLPRKKDERVPSIQGGCAACGCDRSADRVIPSRPRRGVS